MGRVLVRKPNNISGESNTCYAEVQTPRCSRYNYISGPLKFGSFACSYMEEVGAKQKAAYRLTTSLIYQTSMRTLQGLLSYTSTATGQVHTKSRNKPTQILNHH